MSQSLPSGSPTALQQTPSEMRAATAAEAVEGLTASREAAAVSNVLSGLAEAETWLDVAYISMCKRTGSAAGLRILQTSASLLSDGSIEVQGKADYHAPFPEGIAGDFDVASAGSYVCAVRLKRVDPTQATMYEFVIDDTPLGLFTISPEAPTRYSFIVHLSQGRHAFRVLTHGFPFLFYSLTVLRALERSPS